MTGCFKTYIEVHSCCKLFFLNLAKPHVTTSLLSVVPSSSSVLGCVSLYCLLMQMSDLGQNPAVLPVSPFHHVP